jgi:uroporphyrinogen decarboxylase
MNSKERVSCAISLKEPDRIPIFATVVPEIEYRLFEKYGLKGNSLLTFMGNDIVVTSIGVADSFAKIEGSDYKIDEWGIAWKNVSHRKGTYTEIIERPLEKATIKDIAKYSVPDPYPDSRYENIYGLIEEFSDFSIMVDLSCTIFEISHYLRGMENLLIDMMQNKEFANTLFDKVLEFYIPAARKIAGMGVDIIWIGDDVGMQTGMLLSPELFRDYLKERYRTMIREIKIVNKNVKVAFHSDGYIMPVINDLIELGVDILNPVQPNCMNPAVVKEKFGKSLCFMGTIDEQHTLPFGTEEDLKNEIDERIKIVGKGGGLILGPTHNIQSDTELEKIEILFDHIKKKGVYK